MDHLEGGGRTGLSKAVLVLVVVLTGVLGVIMLVSARTGTGAKTTPSAAAPPSSAGASIVDRGVAVPEGSATSIRLPAEDCRGATAVELPDLDVTLPAPSRSADPLADLEISNCGTGGVVVVAPHGDALVSPAGIAADADYFACAEAMREGTVTTLPIAPGTTFCALQRADTIAPSGGQTAARLTVTGIDGGGISLDVVRWRV